MLEIEGVFSVHKKQKKLNTKIYKNCERRKHRLCQQKQRCHHIWKAVLI